ncbi:hypothetical protein [Streptomyces sp. OE57]|uniref:hypothetical protein n=1 Tax=Streptomyces lacaronensis TaxID=3379885 RepID=UPI0039B77A04
MPHVLHQGRWRHAGVAPERVRVRVSEPGAPNGSWRRFLAGRRAGPGAPDILARGVTRGLQGIQVVPESGGWHPRVTDYHRWNLLDQQPERAKQLVVTARTRTDRAPETPRTQGRSAAGPDLALGATPEGSSEALTVWRAGIPVVAWDGRTIRDPDFVQQLRQKQADANGYPARLREAASMFRVGSGRP